MEKKGYLKLAEKYCKFAKEKGASEVQIYIYDGKDFNCECREGNIEQLDQANTVSADIKVWVDKKSSNATLSVLNEGTMEEAILAAIERAKYSSADEFAGLPTSFGNKPNLDKLDLYCKDIENMPTADKIAYAKQIEAIALKDKRIKASGGATCSTSVATRTMANSNGFSGEYVGTYFSGGITLQSGDRDKFQEDGWYEAARRKVDIKSPKDLANKAIDRVVRLVGAKKINSQVVPVVFDPQVAGSLIGFLLSCLRGNAIYMKQSFLVDKLNTQIANSKLSIIDDPLLPHLVGTRPWDSEGVATKKTSIVENGVLKSYLLDTYSAKKLGMASTGHAGGVCNCYVQPGTHSLDEIVKTIDKGLYITKTIGQGTVPTSGDISKGAFGIWIENGKFTYPVDEITFTGNIGDMIKNIDMIGNDLAMLSSVNSPSLKINNVSISGK